MSAAGWPAPSHKRCSQGGSFEILHPSCLVIHRARRVSLLWVDTFDRLCSIDWNLRVLRIGQWFWTIRFDHSIKLNQRDSFSSVLLLQFIPVYLLLNDVYDYSILQKFKILDSFSFIKGNPREITVFFLCWCNFFLLFKLDFIWRKICIWLFHILQKFNDQLIPSNAKLLNAYSPNFHSKILDSFSSIKSNPCETNCLFRSTEYNGFIVLFRSRRRSWSSRLFSPCPEISIRDIDCTSKSSTFA